MALIEWLILRALGESYISLFAAGSAGTIIFGAALVVLGFLTRDDREMIRLIRTEAGQFRIEDWEEKVDFGNRFPMVEKATLYDLEKGSPLWEEVGMYTSEFGWRMWLQRQKML